MNKNFILVVLALFGVMTFAQNGFRPMPIPTSRPSSSRSLLADDFEDNNLASFGSSFGGKQTYGGPLINRPEPIMNFDDFADDIFKSAEEVFYENQPPGLRALMTGKSGVYVEGGSARPNGIGWNGVAQVTGPIGSKGSIWGVGVEASYYPGSRVDFKPHVGVRIPF